MPKKAPPLQAQAPSQGFDIASMFKFNAIAGLGGSNGGGWLF